MILKDKVALVTGGSRGLGREMVLGFAEQGADVVIASRKIDDVKALAHEVEERYGRRALSVACNVADWSQCDALTEAAYSAFGRVDVLVNNAGISPLYPGLSEVSEALYDKVLAVNLKGPFRLTATIGERMAAADGGAVINISSAGSLRPDPLFLPYAAAKAGLNALTEGFARAFAPKVRVNAIVCGTFTTDVSKAWPQQVHDAIAERVLLGRAGDPSEIVGTALYLASDASSYCTGALLQLDGGQR